MYIRETVMALLLINACFFIYRSGQRPGVRRDTNEVDVKIKSVGYLLMNIVCIVLAFYLDK